MTSSKVTSKEIGTKLLNRKMLTLIRESYVNRRIQVPVC